MFSRNLSLIIRSSPASPAPTPSTAPLVGAAQSLELAAENPRDLSLARDAQTGAVTITYSEPAGCPVKFHWTTTISLDGSTVTTPVVAG